MSISRILESLRRDILAAIDKATGPRFCPAILTDGIFYFYRNEDDTEFHVPITDVATQFDKGTLHRWIRSLTSA